jgi:predicted ferric reductase
VTSTPAAPFVTALDLSNFAGLGAIGLLSLNTLLGLLLTHKYNPVRRWPHRRINTVRVHNWTGYTALALAFVHPVLLLFSATAEFGVLDVLWPLGAPRQPVLTALGALAFWLLLVVVATSLLWQERHAITRRTWKRLHLVTYALFPLYAIHAIFSDPALKDHAPDYLDGEKVYVELCVLVVIAAIVWRVRWQAARPPARVHRARRAA